MEMWPLSVGELKAFFLILIRISVVLFMFPFFNTKIFPVLSKAGLVLMVTVALFPVVGNQMFEFPVSLFGMMQLILSELMMGMILGLLVQVFFEGIKMMGQLVGFQTGFAIANIIDPQSGIQVSILSNMAYFVAMILFLLLNGHHILLSAMKESFEIIPVGALSLRLDMLGKAMHLFGGMFVIAVKIGAPALAALLFTKVAFGLIVKLIPQMNIMIVAFPVQIVIGLMFFGISLNILLVFMEAYLGDLRSLLINTMTWLRV
jgi:flagellar biosynthetic protein FliR